MSLSFNQLLHKPSNINIYGSQITNSRYVLDMQFPSGNGTAIAILLNPSSTGNAGIFYNVPFQNWTDFDRTTVNVMNKLQSNQNYGPYQRIITLNVYPYYSTKPNVLRNLYYKTNNNVVNQSWIKQTIQNNSSADIYIAWGKKHVYTTDFLIIVNILSQFGINDVYGKNRRSGNFVKIPLNRLTKNAFYHGLMW